MKRTLTLIAIVIVALTLAAQDQPQMPKPGPEHQRLHYYVGDWQIEGQSQPSAFGPGGKFTSTDHDEMLGDFFLVFHTDSSGSMGNQKGIAVMGYDPKEKVYTYDGFGTSGGHDKATGTISGDTWHWMFSGNEGGKAIKGRIAIKEVSPTSYTFSEEMSVDGKPFTKISEFTATKK